MPKKRSKPSPPPKVEPRSGPPFFLWPTWVTALLSGENQCQYQAWWKCRNKAVDTGKRQRMADYSAAHADIVNERAESLRQSGYQVRVENQNKFFLRGDTHVSGQADILAMKPKWALIVDAKGGKPGDKDLWQVRFYMAVMPLANPQLFAGRELVGEVYYSKSHTQPVTINDENRQRIYAQIRRSGAGEEPDKTPSESECKYCDVVGCEARVEKSDLNGSSQGLF